jgi:bifunctional DNase/RNase
MRVALPWKFAAALALLAPPAVQAEDIKVESAEVRASALGAVVLLRIGNRAIPVFVDPVVAESIQGALGGRKPVRPLSHDLMHTVLTAFEGRVSQVVVTLHEGIYYGALTVVMRDRTKVFDSRSSDAIALAIHSRAPILVSRELLDSAGIEIEAGK